MDLKVTLNIVTARALLFLIFASLRLLNLEKLAIPFILINDSTSFLLNVGLIPIAFLLLVMVKHYRLYIIIGSKMNANWS